MASTAVERRRFRAVTLGIALALLAAAHAAPALDPRAAPVLTAAGVGFAAAGGGLPGLVLAVFGAGLAPLDTELRVAFAVGAVAIYDRASRRDDAATRLGEDAVRDRLTGLHTYAWFADALQREVGRVRRYGGSCALVVLDLDRFKDLNDRHGHAAGNEVLARVGAAIRAEKRESDLAARFGGEELVVLAPDTTARQAAALAERIRLAVADLRVPAGAGRRPLRVTVSAGVAAYPDDARGADELFAAADAALYRAKRDGRDRVALSTTPAVAREPARRPAAVRRAG